MMRQRQLEVKRLGRVAYGDGLDLQKQLETEVIARREKDYLLLLEHPHTYTLRTKRETRRSFGNRRRFKISRRDGF